MRHKAETGTVNRRNFLRTASVAPAAAVATAALPGAAEAYDPGREETKARYRETDHVKAYYRTNGYETLKK